MEAARPTPILLSRAHSRGRPRSSGRRVKGGRWRRRRSRKPATLRVTVVALATTVAEGAERVCWSRGREAVSALGLWRFPTSGLLEREGASTLPRRRYLRSVSASGGSMRCGAIRIMCRPAPDGAGRRSISPSQASGRHSDAAAARARRRTSGQPAREASVNLSVTRCFEPSWPGWSTSWTRIGTSEGHLETGPCSASLRALGCAPRRTVVASSCITSPTIIPVPACTRSCRCEFDFERVCNFGQTRKGSTQKNTPWFERVSYKNGGSVETRRRDLDNTPWFERVSCKNGGSVETRRRDLDIFGS